MNELLTKLLAPFHPSNIEWKPGALSGKKDKALALAYADVRAYQSRLDEVCGLDWSVTYTPWVDRIICHLTISGVTRSATGEADAAAERNENAGTSAEAQAFKRACAMFGLGRYLYNLPSLWVEYDAANGRFADQAKTRLQSLIAQHYQRWLDGRPTDSAPAIVAGEPDTWTAIPNATESDRQLITLFDEAGAHLYGEQWPTVRAKNIKRITKNNPNALTAQHIQALINGMNELKERRQAA